MRLINGLAVVGIVVAIAALIATVLYTLGVIG